MSKRKDAKRNQVLLEKYLKHGGNVTQLPKGVAEGAFDPHYRLSDLAPVLPPQFITRIKKD